MILGLLLGELKVPIVPLVLEIIGGVVLLAGIAFAIFRRIYEKGESDIDPVLYKKISVIAMWTFVAYAIVELIAASACVCINEACRNQYHYDIKNCPFCMSDPNFKKNNHSSASDCLTLGTYFDVFIVAAFITNSIKIIKDKLDSRRSPYST